MPLVNAPTRTMSNGETVIEFVDTASPAYTTYTFTDEQEGLTVTNNGSDTITFRVNGTEYPVQPGKDKRVSTTYTSVDLKSNSGTQEFRVYAWSISNAQNLSVENLAIGDMSIKDGSSENKMKVNPDGSIGVQLSGSSLQETKTNADAVSGTLTFAENISYIEIFNTDPTNKGVFNVNGLNIHVPPNTPWDNPVGGTPRKTVTVTGSTSYIVNRY